MNDNILINSTNFSHTNCSIILLYDQPNQQIQFNIRYTYNIEQLIYIYIYVFRNKKRDTCPEGHGFQSKLMQILIILFYFYLLIVIFALSFLRN